VLITMAALVRGANSSVAEQAAADMQMLSERQWPFAESHLFGC
jgi:hypothetical protein